MKKITMLAMICFFAASGIGLARERCGMGEFKVPHGKWWQMPGVAKKLGLTSEEQQKLDDLFLRSRRQMIDLTSSVQKEKLELEMILDEQNFDEPACRDRFKKFQHARTNVANERFGFLIEVRKLLGHDRYRQLKTEFRERGMHRMKGPEGCRGPLNGRRGIPE
jgi:Spy/CpxP family protein refolding chaperone